MKENFKKEKLMSYGVISLVIVVAVLLLLNNFYIDYLWFEELEYTQIFFKEILTKLTLGVPMFIGLSIISLIYFKFLFNFASKKEAKVISDKKTLKDRLYILLGLGYSLIISVIATNALWYSFLEFTNASPFGEVDPIFGKDIFFYVFKLPFYEQLLSTGMFVLISLFIVTIISVISLSFGNVFEFSINDFSSSEKNIFKEIWKNFKVPISIFLMAFFLLQAVGSYFSMYSILYSSAGVVYGAGYTDVYITLNVYRVSMVLYGFLGIASIYAGIKDKFKVVAFGVAALVLVSIGGVFLTFIVESFVVSPNQFSLEEKYIENNIALTREGYNLSNVEEKEFKAENNLTANDIIKNQETINNIPINDFRPAIEMYNSIQGFRLYYEFNDVDVDRYTIDGAPVQTFISVRELNNEKLDGEAQTWVNLHTKYTHGFGSVVSPVNDVTSSGQPVLLQQDIPPQTTEEEFELTQPRIYYGELTNSYAITNGKTMEFDYPDGSNNAENYYEGEGGIPLSGLNRLAFAIDNKTTKILFSSDITSDSKILIRRNVMERVETIAPFLSYDSDPYAVIDEGKIYWIIDAFTTTNRYPYSKPTNNEDMGSFNYIRNSIKVVVDAYNGDVTFYQVDESDPLALMYSKLYPEFLTPLEEMPEGLKDHLRYSETLFDVQSDIYATYHMSNTNVFYNKEDQWEIATQFYDSSKESQQINPAYMVTRLPDREGEEFVLTIPFTPQNKDNMVGILAAFCDGEDYGKLTVYKFPKQELVYGPMQIEQRIEQDTIISPQLTLLSQQGSEVLRGNLLSIPIEDSILYVEPVYVQASGGERSLPELKKVILSYDDDIIMADSLEEGMAQIFDVSSKDLGSSSSGSNTTVDTTNPTTQSLITKANIAFENATKAQQEGDWASYGKYMDELESILNQLNE